LPLGGESKEAKVLRRTPASTATSFGRPSNVLKSFVDVNSHVMMSINYSKNSNIRMLAYVGEPSVGNNGKLPNCPDGDDQSFMYCCISGPRVYCCGLEERVRAEDNSR
jgi:hypothetical protein